MSQTTVNKTHEVDMTTGSLFPKIVAFAVPLILTSILQLLFNSADMIVVGKFVSNDAMGAVGATGSISSLIINLAIGFSAGAGVVLAGAYGAKNKQYGDKILHTSMFLAVVSGIVIGVVGFLFARQLLTLMNTNVEHIEYSVTYMQIVFLGSPFNMVYNFGASMLRATGDTKRPLLFLSLAGVINIIVNIVTVVCLGMGVAGVALATIFSQAVSAVLVVVVLVRSKGFVKLDFRKIRPDGAAMKEIVRLGLPTGIQNCLFNITNVMLQAAVNGFGSVVVNGSTVSSQLEGYIYALNSSVSATALTVVGQNYGAGDYKRIRKTVHISVALVTGLTLVAGWLVILLNDPLCRIFVDTQDPAMAEQILQFAFQKSLIVIGTYFLDGIMEVVTYSLRAIGYPLTSMFIVFGGVCVLRIIWIFAVFPFYKQFWFLFLMYPLSWLVTLVVAWILLEKRITRDGARLEIARAQEQETEQTEVAEVEA